jgi:hypothetical protein
LARDPTDPWLELDRIEEKIKEGKTWCDPARLGCKSLTFIFFYYVVLIFLKKKFNPNNPMTRSKPKIQ